MLKNPFYIGRFLWRGVEYKGLHAPLISPELFQRVQEAFASHHKPRYRKHNFAFAGLLRCVHDGCTVTTELQKGRYIYYRCSQDAASARCLHARGRTVRPLGELLKCIYVPETIVRKIVDSLESDLGRIEMRRREQLAALQQRLSAIRTRMDQIYDDKLEGKIDENFWTRKQADYRGARACAGIAAFEHRQLSLKDECADSGKSFELANKAHFLYLTRNSAERGQLLKSVLLNCATDGVSLSPTYRKPFDLIF